MPPNPGKIMTAAELLAEYGDHVFDEINLEIAGTGAELDCIQKGGVFEYDLRGGTAQQCGSIAAE